MRSRLAVLAALAAVLAGCGGSTSGTGAAELRGTELDPPTASPEFTLTDQDGRRVSLSDERGHWVVVNFLYVSCPDVCPAIAGHFNNALRTREGEAAGLRVLTLSVDPERDTPRAVREYVHQRRLVPGYRYLIGTRAELEPVWRDYHIAVLPGPKGSITHTTTSLLIDPQGRGRLLWSTDVQTADVVHDLALLLNREKEETE